MSKSLEYTDAGYVVTEALSITLTLFNILDKETRQEQDKTLYNHGTKIWLESEHTNNPYYKCYFVLEIIWRWLMGI